MRNETGQMKEKRVERIGRIIYNFRRVRARYNVGPLMWEYKSKEPYFRPQETDCQKHDLFASTPFPIPEPAKNYDK